MKKLTRALAGIIALSALMSATLSCSSKKDDSSSESHVDQYSVTDYEGLPEADAKEDKPMDIVWLSYYDLNPEGKADRSVALSLFEDRYGGSIKSIVVNPEEKFTILSTKIAAGDQVDMFPYEWDAVPNGVMKNQYAPLDPYYDSLGMNEDGLWDDMKDVIDMFEYNGGHYVIPYSISDPLLITYSRKLMQQEGLDDPYELYLDGEWDWDAFMDMMEQFVENAPSGTQRYGINGWFGQAVIQSTGHTVINYDGEKFSNNINDPELEKAELLLQEISRKQLYLPGWIGYFPNDQSTLFFAMADWALGTSNAKNEGADLMVVPFPKEPGAKDYYLCCNYGARMLVNHSDRGDAVATYIMCERYAATEQKYRDAAKQKALIVEKTGSGLTKSFVTEEQYDAIQSYLDPSNIVPMFDFGYGMGERMYRDGDYTYETRGVMNNLENALLEGTEGVDSWATLRDAWTGVITEEVNSFNN